MSNDTNKNNAPASLLGSKASKNLFVEKRKKARRNAQIRLFAIVFLSTLGLYQLVWTMYEFYHVLLRNDLEAHAHLKQEQSTTSAVSLAASRLQQLQRDFPNQPLVQCRTIDSLNITTTDSFATRQYHMWQSATQPDIMIVGAQKAGTTALDALLSLHPHVVSSSSQRRDRRSFQSTREKSTTMVISGGEPHFFDFHYRSLVQRFSQSLDTARKAPSQTRKEYLPCYLKRQYQHLTHHDQLVYKKLQELQSSVKVQVPAKTVPRIVTVDKSPSYLMYPHIPSALAELYDTNNNSTAFSVRPGLLLVLLRDPVERLLSHYQMQVRLGRTNETLATLLGRELNLLSLHGRTKVGPKWSLHEEHYDFDIVKNHIDDSLDDLSVSYGTWYDRYLQRGMYAVQLRRWLQHFPLCNSSSALDASFQLAILPYEVFRSYPQQVYSFILQQAGLPPYELPQEALEAHYLTQIEQNILDHTSPDKSVEIDALLKEFESELPSIRSFLQRFYQPYNAWVVELLGDDWNGIWAAHSGVAMLERWIQRMAV